MASKRFRKLERHIEREYEKKGYSYARADYIGKAVAGRIARERRKNRG